MQGLLSQNDPLTKSKWRNRGAAGALGLVLLTLFTACSALINSAADDLATNLAQAIANNDDVVTVETGSPAYLLLIEALASGAPDNPKLLAQAARMHSTYAGAFVDDTQRARKLATKALDYALRAVCADSDNGCGLRAIAFQTFQQRLGRLQKKDVSLYYTLGAAWAGWIQAHKDDFNALAELAQVEAIMHRVLELDEGHEDGGAHLYLGSFAILLPPALGGKPDVARRHFERAIALSGGKNLMINVIYAKMYARMVFDRTLHDRLLQQVLDADPERTGYVLINTIAQQQARELLAGSEDYF